MIKVRIGWADANPFHTEQRAINAIKAFVGEDWENIPFNVETKFTDDNLWWHSGSFYEVEVEDLQEIIETSTVPVIFHKPLGGIHYATIWNGYIE